MLVGDEGELAISEIREFRPSDLVAVSRLLEKNDEYHRAELPWMFRKPDTPGRPSTFYDTVLRGDDAQIFVAVEGKRAVGVVTVRLARSPQLEIFVKQLRASVDDVYVEPDQRRKGVASNLLAAAERWAATRGAVWIDLNVFDFNSLGQGLFEAAGFKPLSHKLAKKL